MRKVNPEPSAGSLRARKDCIRTSTAPIWCSGPFAVVLILGLVSQAVSPARANGWEHWGIPLDVLLETLTGDDPAYRLRAAHSLGIRREQRAVAPMLALLERSDEPLEVRVETAEALGQIGDTAALPLLRKMLREDPSDELRAGCAMALGLMGQADALPALLDSLRKDSSIVVRGSVTSALGAFADRRAVDALGALALDRKQPSLRLKAIRALGRTRAPAAAGILVNVLEEAQDDRSRLTIVDALGSIADPGTGDALQRLFERTENAALKVHITVALGGMRGGGVVPGLIGLLTHELAPVRFFAVQGLQQSNDGRAVQPLRELYRRASSDAAATRSAALSGGGSGEHVAHQSLRLAALRALNVIDAPAALDEFLAAAAEQPFERNAALKLRLNEGVYEIRRLAIVGLGYTRAPAAARYLIDRGTLADSDFRIRAAAVRALGVLGVFGNIDSSAAVLSVIDDPSPEVRWVAAKTLGRLAGNVDGDAIGVLQQRLDDDHPEVRTQAVLSLGYLGARTARESLTRLADNDSAESVRKAARAALSILDP